MNTSRPNASSLAMDSFTLERSYPYPPARVFRAWADPKAKAAWFGGPDDWDHEPNQMDFREGGDERIAGGPPGGPVHLALSHYYDIVPNQRIVFTYEMYLGETRISVSLGAVEFHPSGGGTRLVFHEHAAFLDGFPGMPGRREGTDGLLDQLSAYLEQSAKAEFLSSRVFAATPDEVYAAWSDPKRLARWWGPAGFTSTFETCDFREGGDWTFVMHGPDGTSYPNRSIFRTLVPGQLIVLEHLDGHHFTMTITLEPVPGGTRLTWMMRFDSAEEVEPLRPIIEPANEQNLDRLAAELGLG